MSDKLVIKRKEWDQQADNTNDVCNQVCRTVDEQEFMKLITDIKKKLFITETYDSILDVGCGNAAILSYFKNSFNYIYGIDFSSSMIKKAKEIISEGIFSQGEATSLDFKSGCFDRVLAYSIFHYFPSIDYGFQAIQEMIRVCKKGGVIIIGDVLDKVFEDEIKGGSDLEYEKIIPLIYRHSQWCFFDLVDIQKHFKAQGYKVEILSQPTHFKCAYYRKDIRIWV